EGQVATVQNDGTVQYETPSVDASNVDNGKKLTVSDGITIDVSDNSALLEDLSLGLKDVPVDKLEKGNDNQVLVTDDNGGVNWVDQSALPFENIYTTDGTLPEIRRVK